MTLLFSLMNTNLFTEIKKYRNDNEKREKRVYPVQMHELKKRYVLYLKELLKYYKSKLYRKSIKQFKKESKGKKFKKVLEIFDRIMKKHKKIVVILKKKYNLDLKKILKIQNIFQGDKKILNLMLKIARYYAN